MRETGVENHLKDVVRRMFGRAYKWVCPGRRGVPDQIILMFVPPEHRELVARYIRFAETKQYDRDARGQQELRHAELRDLGFRVDVIDSKWAADQYVRDMG